MRPARTRAKWSPAWTWILPCLALSFLMLGACSTTSTSDDSASGDTPASLAVDQAGQETEDGDLIILEGDQDAGAASGLADAAAVFAAASPAVVLVETASGIATGAVIAGGYVLTNAAAVWPHGQASVRLRDGAPAINVPVLGVDRLRDVAVLGPLADPPAILSVDNEPPAIGTLVYLLAFTGADGDASQPSISAGLVSGDRRWPAGGITFLQSDAPVAPSQAGGVLISGSGTLIGLAGPGFGSGGFNHFASLAAVRDAVGSFTNIAGAPAPFAFDQAASTGAASFAQGQRELVYVLDGEAGAPFSVSVQGDANAALRVVDARGDEVASADDTALGVEVASGQLTGVAPFFLIVVNVDGAEAVYDVSANPPIVRLDDADDGQVLTLDTPVLGTIDRPGDLDRFQLQLNPGEVAEVLASSIAIDAFLAVNGPEGAFVDDDSGGGPLGVDALVRVESAAGGVYAVEVSDVLAGGGGAYVLEARRVATTQPPTGAEAPPAAGPAVTLPAGRGVVVRGAVVDGALLPRIATVGATVGEGASLVADDPDGVFRVVATVVAMDSANLRVQVVSADGAVQLTAPGLTVTCGTGACAGAVDFVLAGNAADGPWTVRLLVDAGAITDWQLELRADPNDAGPETLPAQTAPESPPQDDGA